MSVVCDTARLTLVALMVGGIAAAAVAVAASASLRAWFGLTPEHPAAVPAWELWLHNARVWLLAFWAVVGVTLWQSRWARGGFDVLMCLWFGWNVLLVAMALGAYGGRLLRLAPAHYVFELLALATAGAAYLDARRERVFRPRVVGGCALMVAVLLVGAAVTEGAV